MCDIRPAPNTSPNIIWATTCPTRRTSRTSRNPSSATRPAAMFGPCGSCCTRTTAAWRDWMRPGARRTAIWWLAMGVVPRAVVEIMVRIVAGMTSWVSGRCFLGWMRRVWEESGLQINQWGFNIELNWLPSLNLFNQLRAHWLGNSINIEVVVILNWLRLLTFYRNTTKLIYSNIPDLNFLSGPY